MDALHQGWYAPDVQATTIQSLVFEVRGAHLKCVYVCVAPAERGISSNWASAMQPNTQQQQLLDFVKETEVPGDAESMIPDVFCAMTFKAHSVISALASRYLMFAYCV